MKKTNIALASKRTAVWRSLLLQYGGLLLALLLLMVAFSLKTDHFLSLTTLRTISNQIPYAVLLAVGMTCVMIVGGIDLSVGSVMFVAAALAGKLVLGGQPLWLACAVILLTGLVYGAVNALFITRLRVIPFIVTLAMLSILRGLAYTFTDAAVQNAHNIEAFRAIGIGFIAQLPVVGRVPWPVVITAVIFAVFAVILTRTTLGRYIYAVGGNPRAAALSGVRVYGVKTLAFVITAVLAALSAFILIARMNSGQNNAGFGFELQVIGAVLLGGASLAGGQGTLVGTLLAVLLLGTLNNGIILLGINSHWQVAVNGFAILIAVFLDARRRRALGQD